jgi:magnesium chelatase accessory protein
LDNARDVRTILASVVPPSPVLFGHSFGSMVAVMVAASGMDLSGLILGDAPFSPERVRAAIAPDGDALRRVRAVCGPGPPMEDVIAAVRSWPALDEDGTEITFGEALADHPEEFAFAAETFAQHDPTFLDGVLDGFDRMWEGYEARLLLPEITCPVLLVRCDPSAGGKLSDADVAVGLSMMPSADVVRLPGVGHLFFRGDPEATLAALTPFLERIRSV